MWKFLIPRIAWYDLPATFAVALIGAIVASIYGILHDQVTYTISPEYFTKMKYQQFHYADFGLGDRFFVAIIGVLATWWVGLIIAWLLARRFIPGQPRAVAFRQIRLGFLCVFGFGISLALLGYGYGQWRGPEADYTAWHWAANNLQITDLPAFVQVAYIHNASYLGGVVGLIAALVFIRPVREADLNSSKMAPVSPTNRQ